MRYLALVLGSALVVLAGVGAFIGRSEALHERDATVVTLAEVGSSEVAGIVGHAALAAELAAGPDEFIRAFTLVGPLTVVDAALREPAVPRGSVELGADGDTLVVVATGETVRGTVDLPVDALAERVGRRDVTLSVVPLRSVETPHGRIGRGQPWTVDGRRTYAVPVEGASAWAVVATVADAPALEPAHRNRLLAAGLSGLLLLVLGVIALGSQQRRLLERATVDPLTRLPNRSELEDRGATMVELARRTGDGACVMVVDLDGFKQINDDHGHAAGDEVLRVVGMRLRHAVRGYDLVARWGGDEFVVLLSGVADPAIAQARAGALAASVSRPIEPRHPTDDAMRAPADRLRSAAPSIRLQVGASIGLAMLGIHGDDLAALLAAADAAMYEAKRAGLDHQMAMAPTLEQCSTVTS